MRMRTVPKFHQAKSGSSSTTLLVKTLGLETEILALKHQRRIIGRWSNPVSGSRKSQASYLVAFVFSRNSDSIFQLILPLPCQSQQSCIHLENTRHILLRLKSFVILDSRPLKWWPRLWTLPRGRSASSHARIWPPRRHFSVFFTMPLKADDIANISSAMDSQV